MKQNIYIGTRIESQNGQNIKIAFEGVDQSINQLYPNFINGQIGSISTSLSVSGGNLRLGRDGPPGNTLKLSNTKSIKSMNFNILITTKFQLFTNIYHLQS